MKRTLNLLDHGASSGLFSSSLISAPNSRQNEGHHILASWLEKLPLNDRDENDGPEGKFGRTPTPETLERCSQPTLTMMKTILSLATLFAAANAGALTGKTFDAAVEGKSVRPCQRRSPPPPLTTLERNVYSMLALTCQYFGRFGERENNHASLSLAQ
jgi:hypothetical protein